MIIIYSQNTILLYMFRASSAHLQEDTVVYMQHMVLSLSMRVPGGPSVLKLCTDLVTWHNITTQLSFGR